MPTTTEVQTAKHTPGPWQQSGPTVMAEAPLRLIATVGAPSSRDDEDAANAKLIAAAPALLAALVAFMPELEQRERFISANDSPWSQSERLMLDRIWMARKAVKDAGVVL